MITNFSNTNTIVSEWMRELRDINIQTDRMRFRYNLERIGQVAAYEISKHMPYINMQVQTPLATASCMVMQQPPVIATILRAGMPLYQGLLNFFDHADSSFIGAYRRHNETGGFEINQQYLVSPSLTDRVLIVADPMLATGASMILAIESLLMSGDPVQIHIVSVIASTEGIDLVQRRFPDAYIWAGAIDDELTANKYILPGLGDAGDLAFGEKRQY